MFLKSKFCFFRYDFVDWHSNLVSFRLCVKASGFSCVDVFITLFILLESEQVRGELLGGDEVLWNGLGDLGLAHQVAKCLLKLFNAEWLSVLL